MEAQGILRHGGRLGECQELIDVLVFWEHMEGMGNAGGRCLDGRVGPSGRQSVLTFISGPWEDDDKEPDSQGVQKLSR